jgi:hypothetical protein
MSEPELIQQSPEAQAFLLDVRNHIASYLLHPDEQFSDLGEGVLGGTATDQQGEASSLDDLNELIKRIGREPFWITLNHDPRIHPVGRVIAAKIFKVPESENHFVAALTGTYSGATIPTIENGRKKLGGSSDAEYALTPELSKSRLSFNIYELPFELIQEMIEVAPLSVDNKVAEERRKALDPLVILRLMLPGGLLFGAATKIGGKIVEHFADDVFVWVKSTVLKKLGEFRKRNNRETLFVFESHYKGCTIEFVISSQDEMVRIDAVDGVYAAAAESKSIVDAFESQKPTRLTFDYDTDRKKWLPLYIVTNRGIFTDSPYLQVIRARGLSLTTRRTEE